MASTRAHAVPGRLLGAWAAEVEVTVPIKVDPRSLSATMGQVQRARADANTAALKRVGGETFICTGERFKGSRDEVLERDYVVFARSKGPLRA